MTSRLSRPTAGLSRELLAQAHEWDAEPVEGAEPEPAWTIGRIKRAARMAASRCRLPPSSLCDDPVALAESGVGLAVAVDPHVPWADAVEAGQQEIWDASRATRKSIGVSLTGSRQPAANFWRFWQTQPPPLGMPSTVDNSQALAAVLSALPPTHLDTLLLIAFGGSTETAAERAGCSVQAMRVRAQKARRAALALWFDWETPPQLSRLPPYRIDSDRVCKACGREISGGNVRWDRSASGRRHARCKACRTERDRLRRAGRRSA